MDLWKKISGFHQSKSQVFLQITLWWVGGRAPPPLWPHVIQNGFLIPGMTSEVAMWNWKITIDTMQGFPKIHQIKPCLNGLSENRAYPNIAILIGTIDDRWLDLVSTKGYPIFRQSQMAVGRQPSAHQIGCTWMFIPPKILYIIATLSLPQKRECISRVL